MSPDEIGCVEAELAVLGCLLRLPAARVLEVARRLTVEDFVDPAGRNLLGVIAAVAVQGLDPDPVLVVGELRRRGLEASFTAHQGAAAYALEVFTAAGVPGSVEAYVRILLDHAWRRRVHEAGVRLQQAAHGGDLDELHDQVDGEQRALTAAWSRLRRETPGLRSVAS